jgi:putative flippase GtrA
MVMGIATLFLDTALLVLFVKYGDFPYVPAAALAILIAFIARFLVARSWVWKKTPAKKK